MFGYQFYPTPKEVIRKMIDPFVKPTRKGTGMHWYEDDGLPGISIILDPSAGKGDILDYCLEFVGYTYSKPICYAIEIDLNLQAILRDKNYKLLGENFLDYSNQMNLGFDLILMNPPFSEGAKHLLHAWDIIEEGNIVCLLNAETILNPHTAERELLLKIIEDHGSFEIIGPVFKDAENPTDVDVALVRLTKKNETPTFDFKFDERGKLGELNLEGEAFANAIATTDIIGNMILRFKMAQEAFVDICRGFAKLAFANQDLVPSHWRPDEKYEYNPKGYADFSQSINSGMWAHVISKLNCEKLMTHRIQNEFSNFIKEQGYLEFSKKNIANLVTMLFENQFNILEKAIVDVFDIFTSYHKENRCYVEGWKTNDSWKVNRKVILPRWLTSGEYMSADSMKKTGDRIRISHHHRSEYSDIDKVMAFISGTPYEQVYTLFESLDYKLDKLGYVKTGDKFDNTGESTFFRYKFFRKGTLHIEFRDEKLWQEFNMRACAGKNWLPPAEKKRWEESKKPKEVRKEVLALPKASIEELVPELFT